MGAQDFCALWVGGMSTRGKQAATETEIDPSSPPETAPPPVSTESSALLSARKELAKLHQRYLSAVEKGGRQKAAAKAELDKVTTTVDREIDVAKGEMIDQQRRVASIEAEEASKKAA